MDITQYRNQVLEILKQTNNHYPGFSKYYKDLLYLNNTPNQRQQFESRMQEYLQKGIQQLKEKNIL